MVREASRKSGTILKEDDVVVAVENWRETGSMAEAVQMTVNWIKFGINGNKQLIKNRFLNEPQTGKIFEYFIED